MADAPGGFSVLDGAALVAGAAVASVHIRGTIEGGGVGPGWWLLSLTFSWVALTSAGPFMYALRRYVRGRPGYPKVGDRLWAMLGLPWVLTAVVQTARRPGKAHENELVSLGLSVGLVVVSLVALGVVWTTWVMVSPGRASETFSPPWTNRVGLVLAVAWPVQCGLGMVVAG